MDQGIWAQTLIKRLRPPTENLINVTGLPDWVVEAIADDRIFMTAEDTYKALWVRLDIEHEAVELDGFPLPEGMAVVAMRALPGDILVNHDGVIGILTKITGD